MEHPSGRGAIDFDTAFVRTRPVEPVDIDELGHVNNTVYFRYFENARIAYFEKIKILEYMDSHGVGPILKSAQCTFRIPLTFPDTVSIGIKISDIGKDRFTMQFAVVSHRFQKIAAEGDGVIVILNYKDNCKADVPDSIKERIEAIESGQS